MKKQISISLPTYNREKLDEIYNEIEAIPKSWNPKRINSHISNKLGNSLQVAWIPTKETFSEIILYRARSVSPEEKIKETDPSEFTYAPIKYCKELGRANRIRKQIFYASNKSTSAISEIADNISYGESVVYLSKWRFKKVSEDFKIYPPISENEFATDPVVKTLSEFIGEKYKNICRNLNQQQTQEFLYGIKRYQDLFTNPSKELYHITSSIAYEKFYSLSKQGFDIPIIVYPSVAHDKNALNWAIRKDFTDKYLELVSVDKIKVNNIDKGGDKVKHTILARAHFNNGKLTWKKPNVTVKYLKFNEAFIMLKGEDHFFKIGDSKRIQCCEKHKYNVEDLFNMNGIDEKYINRNIANQDFDLGEKIVHDEIIFDNYAFAPIQNSQYYLDGRIIPENLIEVAGTVVSFKGQFQ